MFLIGNMSMRSSANFTRGELDGRHGGPTISVDRWNEVLLKAGYTGVDWAIPESADLDLQSSHLMVATKPRNNKPQALPEEVFILEPSSISAKLLSLIEALCSRLVALGFSATRIQCGCGLSRLENKRCISLLEIETPIMQAISTEDFLVVQRLLLSSKQMLWVLRGDDPAGSIITGLLRCLRNENINLDLRTLELSQQTQTSLEHNAKLIVSILTLSGPEREFRERDGFAQVARLLPEENMDEQMAAMGSSTVRAKITLGQLSSPVKLDIATPGMLDTLFFSHDPRTSEELAADEIELEVMATALK